jgi:hypothetical protein
MREGALEKREWGRRMRVLLWSTELVVADAQRVTDAVGRYS